jgi:hypothetical protein
MPVSGRSGSIFFRKARMAGTSVIGFASARTTTLDEVPQKNPREGQ